MKRMTEVAVAADTVEGEEIQAALATTGIESHLETAAESGAEAAGEDDRVVVVAPDSSLEAARAAIEGLTEPDQNLTT